MSRLEPLQAGYFRMPDSDGEPARLLGSFSPDAALTFYPRRRRCPVTGGPVEDVELSTRGELYSWTVVAVPMNPSFPLSPVGSSTYAVGQIDLPEGVRVQAIIGGAEGEWRIGMPMRVEVLPLFEDDDGVTRCGFWFVAADEVTR